MDCSCLKLLTTLLLNKAEAWHEDTFCISCSYELGECPPGPELDHLQNEILLLCTAGASPMLRNVCEHIPPVHDHSMHLRVWMYVQNTTDLAPRVKTHGWTHTELIEEQPPKPWALWGAWGGVKGLVLKQPHSSWCPNLVSIKHI